ncbi:MAG: hypothetical protein DRJ60_00235 [Thermoprotei archaeon]|nr:MAG: hypothetical protein DRJ60_00235 [Thermoprotei archaeon]
MVYSVFYYATEAITRAFVGLILKIVEHAKRRRIVEEKRREKRPAPSWGFFKVMSEAGMPEYTWIGRATNLKVAIPGLIRLPIAARELRKPPTRLYFSFAEAASKDWFREIEWLAEQAEKASEEVGEGAS